MLITNAPQSATGTARFLVPERHGDCGLIARDRSCRLGALQCLRNSQRLFAEGSSPRGLYGSPFLSMGSNV